MSGKFCIFAPNFTHFLMKVLYLSEWYPSEQDKMAGLFVQKHAEAVAAQGAEVRVNTWWPEADVVQLNVLSLKKGLMAYVLKRVFGIPYILVEHWSGYLPVNGQYMRTAGWKRALLGEIAREASGIYPVSQMLEEAMKACGIRNRNWGRVHNVVDDFFYEKTPLPLVSEANVLGKGYPEGGRKGLLHVSCFDERPKNVKGLLRAIKVLSEKRRDFVLTLVGTGKDWQMCRDYACELQIPEDMLRWTGELTPEEVCREMQQSDVFVMSSRYENAPVVLSECIAMGLPIVSTQAGGIPEMVTPEMGILVPTEDDEALMKAIDRMLNHYTEYNRAAIRAHGQQYSYESVGKQLMQLYEEARYAK